MSNLTLSYWNCFYCDVDLEDWYRLDEVPWTQTPEDVDWFLFDNETVHHPNSIESKDMICCDQWHSDCTCKIKISGDMLLSFMQQHKIYVDTVYDLNWERQDSFDCSSCARMKTYECIPLRNYVRYFLRKGKTPSAELTPCKFFTPDWDTINAFGVIVPDEYKVESKVVSIKKKDKTKS